MIPHDGEPTVFRLPSEGGTLRKIAALHESPYKVVIACTGAGTGVANLLWQAPGSSQTLLEEIVPYSRYALQDLIGVEPEKYCSEKTAIMMATAAYMRAQELVVRDGRMGDPVIGLGMTAAVASHDHRRGGDRVHAVVRAKDVIASVEIQFPKTLNREAQGKLCDLIGFNLIAWAAGDDRSQEALEKRQICLWRCGIESFHLEMMQWRFFRYTLHPAFIEPPELDVPNLFKFPLIWEDGRQPGVSDDLDPEKHLLFFTSANPLHHGHELVARQAERTFKKRVVMAITQRHPDKGVIPSSELARRAKQCYWSWPVLLSNDRGLYVDKALRYPGMGMLIGADAMMGILDPKYYPGGRIGLKIALETFETQGTMFYVAGREVGGVWRTVSDIKVPFGKRHLFLPIQGRWDVSSTQLRAAK